MREQGAKYNPPPIQLGEVVSSTPLAIITGDLQLNSDNLMIADSLAGKLTSGDIVALVQIDDFSFIIFCKVVRT
jgi:hypothetical protein